MKKIMLVDDVEISNFIMKKMISKIAPAFAVDAYTFPEKAVADVEQISPDVIFLDINMPVMNGWQFLDTMKEKHQTIPVYILTSSTSELDCNRSKNYSNVKDFLIKPVDANALSNILNNI